MPKKKNTNPLSEVQREKAGSTTFDKFNYQYHWALFRVITDHDNTKEYAVFMELHEDVVVANSLNVKEAKFEFNQIKTFKKPLSTKDIITKKKESSILGKLVSNTVGKRFSDKIESLNLVTTNGFNIKLKTPDLKLEIIDLDSIDTKEKEKLKACIKEELELDELPAQLRFVQSALSEKQYQKIVIGEISSLVSKLYPSCQYDSTSIYQLLIDELNVKGSITFDYKDWDEVIQKKALTSDKVKKVIETFTSTKNEAHIVDNFNKILGELGYSTMKCIDLKRDFDRYRLNKLKNKSSIQIDITNEINLLIEKHTINSAGQFSKLIELINGDLSKKIQKEFTNIEQLTVAILAEYLNK